MTRRDTLVAAIVVLLVTTGWSLRASDRSERVHSRMAALDAV
jgi:hypothetical protein